MKIMRRTNFLLQILSAIILCQTLCAAPAKPGAFTLTQPDGTTFRAIIRGDEFTKILTDDSGHSIIQNETGYYCYAFYTSDGKKHPTEFIVGKDAPVQVITKSLSIPYSDLSRNASARRSVILTSNKTRNFVRRLEGASTTKHCIVLLAQFPDLKFTYTKDNFTNLLTQSGYSFNGATGSVKDYFDDQFNGSLSFEFVASDILTMSHGYAYYGKNNDDGDDEKAAELVKEACQAAASTVDFSKYDDDNDGKVDNVFIFFAGGDEAEGAGDSHIWSHQWNLSYAGISLSLGGKVIDSYAMSSELSGSKLIGIGTFCHEFSHSLGLMDMYDTDYSGSGGENNPLMSTAIMSTGNYNNNGNTPPNYNAVDRDMLGIGTEQTLKEGAYSLEPVNLSGKYVKAETDRTNEYYLFECRAKSGWDAYIGGKGMLVYHIDKSTNDSGYSDVDLKSLTAAERWQLNEINCNPAHPCAQLSPAYQDAKTENQLFFPYGDLNSFSAQTTPSFSYWSGSLSSLSLSNIRTSGDKILFSAFGVNAPPKVEMTKKDVFQDAAIISWYASDKDFNGTAKIQYGTTQNDIKEAEVEPYSDNAEFAFTMDNLAPRTAYKVIISFVNEIGEGEKYTLSFTTSSYSSGGHSFIFLDDSIDRNTDGSFKKGAMLPLRLKNAVGSSVQWFLNGSAVTTGGNGYFEVTSSGILKAKATAADGKVDIIQKQIIVK